MHISHYLSRVTEPKFTKFLTDAEGSPAVLTQQSALRSFYQLWNISAQNEDGMRQFFADTRHKSVTTLT